MNTGLRYFMTVVELQGISKAAERLYISQQDLSNHIRRLEKEYGVLFSRKPRFSLTPTGRVLWEHLCKIQKLETELNLELQDIKDNTVGSIRFGIHNARARIILPAAIKKMQKTYPRVQLQMFHADTVDYEAMLERGAIDLFLGINSKKSPVFSYIPFQRETVWLIASKALLNQYGCEPDCPVIDLRSLKKLPLIFSPSNSNLQRKITEFLEEQSETLDANIIVGDFYVQLDLAHDGVGACFCPEMFLAGNASLFTGSNSDLQKYRIEGFDMQNELSLVLYQNAYHPYYLHKFIEILKESASELEII